MIDVCTECGERVNADAEFCPACLATIDLAPQNVAPSQAVSGASAQPQSSSSSKSQLPLLLGGSLALLAIAGFGFSMMGRNPPATDVPPPVASPSPAPTKVPVALPPVTQSRVETAEAKGETIAKSCTVADPTNTPLNLRTEPGGALLAQLPNGRTVDVIKTQSDAKGKTWALIVTYDGADRQRGWVFREFVSCID
jgi:hypothetical protein